VALQHEKIGIYIYIHVYTDQIPSEVTTQHQVCWTFYLKCHKS